MATVFKADGSEYTLDDLSLNNLQKAVGGLIEFVSLAEAILVINEEGKFYDLPYNRKASDLAKGTIHSWDYIAGDAIFITRREHPDWFKENFGPWEDI